MNHLVFNKITHKDRNGTTLETIFHVLNVPDIAKPTYTVRIAGDATYDEITKYLREYEKATEVDVCTPGDWCDFPKYYSVGSLMPKRKSVRAA